MTYSVLVKLSTPTASATYDVSAYGAEVTIDRGRTSPAFEDIDPGDCNVVLNNETRAFDPLYGSSPFYGSVIPGSTVTVIGKPAATEYNVFVGRVEDWNLSYSNSTRSTAIIAASDALAVLGRAEFDEWLASETAAFPLISGRLDAILTRPEVDYNGSTDFDDGPTYLQGDYVSWGSNVLNYCQLIAKTDMGLFFASRDGVVTYRDRLSFIGSSPTVTLGSSSYPVTDLEVSYGAELLYNRVSVTRFGGEPQVVSDATSQSTYQIIRKLTLDNLLMQDDTSALDLATRLLAVYKDPLYRIERMTVAVQALSATEQANVLQLDIGSVVSATFTPNGVGSAITRTCVVEGISHRIRPELHEITFTLNDGSIYQTGNFYTVEDATYGTVGAGGALDYPIAF